LKPNFCDAWSNLSSAYMRKGHVQEAAECRQHALMLNPCLVDAHSNLGNMLKAHGLTHHVSLISELFLS
jgi:tetratricopeptide (TPR) repeat protein